MSSDLRHRMADFRPWRIDRDFAVDFESVKSYFAGPRGTSAETNYDSRCDAHQAISHGFQGLILQVVPDNAWSRARALRTNS